MDNIRQLNASHSANASQVDNVRRMLLCDGGRFPLCDYQTC